MQFSLFALLGLSAFAAAAPQHIRRQASASASSAPFPISSSSSAGAFATGTVGIASATGTGVVPLSTGTGTSCSPNGAVICNGENMFGICNFGRVTFQPVAAGTKCVNGEITV